MEGDFDFVSYDIDKMFGLLSKSNPTVFEWIRAHIIYFNSLPNWDILQKEIVSNFDFKALFHHYISLAKGNINLMETNKKFTYKTAFYCIRGLLSAELASRQIIPKLLIDDLFQQFDTDNEILRIAKDSLERKKEKLEKEEILETEKLSILKAINSYTSHLAGSEPKESNNRDKLKQVLKAYSLEIKTNYYK